VLGSFQFRLLAGFGIVIGLTLFLSASGFVLLLRQQQAEAAEQRIGLAVGPIAREAESLLLQGWPQEMIAERLQDFALYFDVRVLILNSSDRVVIDTDPKREMLGLTLDLPSAVPVESRQMASFQSIRMRAQGEDLYLFTRSEETSVARTVVAVPAGDVTTAWSALLPPLSIAAAGASVVAVLFAFLFAARITTPVREMTRASRAMAAGDLDHRIQGEGRDEIGQLAAAFNQMSAQVARSNEAMRELVANVSHELKTPLTSIQGFSQAMVDGLAKEPEDYAEMSGVVLGETERIRVLVDDLLYLSQIEAGTLRAIFDQVDVDAIVTDAASRFRFQAEEAGVSIALELDGGEVRADGRRLEQVLANLVDNAIRFSPRGAEVRLRTFQLPGEIGIEVHNDGKAIPPEGLPHVFDRFYQADLSRSDGRHSGLGLSIVHELVQAHGGITEVRSSEADGTTFSVRLLIDGPPRGAGTVDGTSEVVS
jgi:signal transduction histidine kinase